MQIRKKFFPLECRFIVCLVILALTIFASSQAYADVVSDELINVLNKHEEDELSDVEAYTNILSLLLENQQYTPPQNISHKFLKSSLPSKFEEQIKEDLLSIIDNQENPLSLLKSHKTAFQKLFPPASPTLYSLNESIINIDSFNECELSDRYPSCLWKIIFKKTKIPDIYLAYIKKKIENFDVKKIKYMDDLMFYQASRYIFIDSKKDSSCSEYFQVPENNLNDDFSSDAKNTTVNIYSLKQVLSRAPECHPTLKSYLLTAGKESIKSENADRVEKAIIYLETMPDTINSVVELKKEVLLNPSHVFRDLGMFYFSHDVFSKFQASERIKLLIFGRLPIFYYLVIALVAVIIVFFVYFMLKYLPLLPDKDKNKVAKTKVKTKRPRPKKKPNPEKGYSKLSEDVDEYTNLLRTFGLTDEASDADIKKAYRDIIKQLHPDSGTPIEQKKFEEIQKAYDRLIEIRRGWFGLSR